jgi:cyclophilin family peptidyl-prolyl cis-trans isomerase
MKKIIGIIAICTLVITACFSQAQAGERTKKEPVFDIVTTMGTIRVKLYNDTPLHRDNFVKLVKKHFFDNILFHRVINGFMIQAGDPQTKNPDSDSTLWGSNDSGYTLPAEFRPNHTHIKGALAAAREGDKVNPNKESSGSQFYIVQNVEHCKHLDGSYTVFGETVSGLDVVDKIAAVPTNKTDCPITPVRIIKIRRVRGK